MEYLKRFSKKHPQRQAKPRKAESTTTKAKNSGALSDNEKFLRNLVTKEREATIPYVAQTGLLAAELVAVLKRAKVPGPGFPRKSVLNIDRYVLGGDIGIKAPITTHRPAIQLIIFMDVPEVCCEDAECADVKALPNDVIPDIMTEFFKLLNKVILDSTNHGVKTFRGEHDLYVSVLYKEQEFYIMPAINFRLPNDPSNAIRDQWIDVLERCAVEGRNLKQLFSSMIEKDIEYVVKQSEFTRSVIILTKFWAHAHGLKFHLRPVIFDLIAIDAGQGEIEDGSPSLLGAFERVLTVFAMPLDKVKVILASGGLEHPAFVKHRMELNEKTDGPLLINPVIPYKNYLVDDDYRNGVKAGWKKVRKISTHCINKVYDEYIGLKFNVKELLGFDDEDTD